ncbi:hypothetical protein THTE_4314 [Thermogutta terrifontis]|uniref:Uncharacterized protein n=1 Tax=Thermogutta terrifontis TaxID=1331910 RepID=A0A286RLR7_9BACT|nr:hypothetical protein [Thermogutta terrifontis]ASV76915.1 hypothetical protein THTE_4314 [Thermogutta terrifontis]
MMAKKGTKVGRSGKTQGSSRSTSQTAVSADRFELRADVSTGNFWFDTGRVMLLKLFGAGTHDVNTVLQELVDRLVEPTGNKGEYFDKTTNSLKEYDKKNWVFPTNLFIKANPSPPKEKRLINGKEQLVFLEPPQYSLKLDLKKKKDRCDICGQEAPVTDATMWMFPFVVDPSKFGCFYSGAKRGLKLCACCALAGLAGYLGWLWRGRRDWLHFFIFHSDMPELRRLHEEILEHLKLKGQRSGNCECAFEGPYIHETTLGLLLTLFQYVRESDKLPEESRQLLSELLGAETLAGPPPMRLYAVTGKPGQAFKMNMLCEFSQLHRLFRFYEKWIEIIQGLNLKDDKPHQRLEKIFGQFYARQGQKYETLWRDKIAWAILEFSDPTPFIEQFLFDVCARAEESDRHSRGLLHGTLNVLIPYLAEVMQMDEKFQKVLAGFGHSLGTKASQQNEMGLLYALRNAKNPEEFYRVLNDAQFRLQITVPGDLLRIERQERIAGVPWVRVKTLLAIYAMNAYLRKGKETTEDANDSDLTTQEDNA